MREQNKVPMPHTAMWQWHSTWQAYNISEYLALIEPAYQVYEEYIRQTILGLTTYAAQCAAMGQEDRVPMLREYIPALASFYDLDERPDQAGNTKPQQEYEMGFDQAVNAARRSGIAPEMTEELQKVVLTGLEMYAQEMEGSGDMNEYVFRCRALMAWLGAEWQIGPAPTDWAEDITRQEQEAGPAMI